MDVKAEHKQLRLEPDGTTRKSFGLWKASGTQKGLA